MKKNAIFIHGLNNNTAALLELGKCFSDQFNIIYLTLPHHRPGPPKDFEFINATQNFKDDLLKALPNTDFILSYSMGCSYLQYLLENKELDFPMERIIYLAPAFKTKLKLSLLGFLPERFPLPSFAPVDFRLRSFCYWGQYKTLLELSSKLKLTQYPLIIADPQDELIDLRELQFIPIKRSYLPYGKHHLIFHPNFFKGDDWEMLIEIINEHLRKVLTI